MVRTSPGSSWSGAGSPLLPYRPVNPQATQARNPGLGSSVGRVASGLGTFGTIAATGSSDVLNMIAVSSILFKGASEKPAKDVSTNQPRYQAADFVVQVLMGC